MEGAEEGSRVSLGSEVGICEGPASWLASTLLELERSACEGEWGCRTAGPHPYCLIILHSGTGLGP